VAAERGFSVPLGTLVGLGVGTPVLLGDLGPLVLDLRYRVRVLRRLLVRLLLVETRGGFLVRVWAQLCVIDLLDLLVTLILNYLILLDQMMMRNALLRMGRGQDL